MTKQMLLRFKISLLSLLFISISCEKEMIRNNIDSNEVENIDINLGLSHNEILSAYFSQIDNDNIDTYSFDKNINIEKVLLTIDEYLIKQGSNIGFSDLYYSNDNIQNSLNKLFDAGTNIDEIKNIIIEENNSNEFLLEQSIKLLNIMELHEGSPAIYGYLNKFKDEILNLQELTLNEKNDLIIAIEIAQYSHEYWYSQENYGVTTYSRGKHIAGADAGGALLMLTSGAVSWGSMFGGPWGGIGVYLGGAAAASIIAALD